ncbi:TerC family protein [Legionella lytica]|uniref:TerC family protein n=1 Tax=Legionella lytica TaxID=96232 RepID=A0ABY4Y5Y6_9GAMM|nr:TerC family protein [Legionella lytica]USQ12650.1 TerC family protein [Legionella lytica]
MEFLDIITSLIVLVILEVVLGIDNLVILSILTEKLPVHQRKKARRWGLTFSWVTRLMLLGLAVNLIRLTRPLITISEFSLSMRDIFLILGGAFLIWKATDEIHQDVIADDADEAEKNEMTSAKASFNIVIFQVGVMDIIFSLDSVLTAVGLTSRFWVMAFAITCAILIMIFASEWVSAFIKKHPTIKMLALSYLILIGMVLVADGLSFHIPRGYLYFAMGFSLAVESLNLIKHSRKRGKKTSGR